MSVPTIFGIVSGIERSADGVVLCVLCAVAVGSVPGILIASKFTVRMPDDVLRLGLAGILALSGLKLLNVPESKWVLGVGLVVVLGGLFAYIVNAWLARPRPATARSFD